MGLMKNEKCPGCKSKTKLLVKNNGKLNWWCSIAKECPYSKPMEKKE